MIKGKFIFILFILFLPFPAAYSQKIPHFANLDVINSMDDDYLPFLEDSVLYFTSTRRNTREGQILEFSEKVYFSVKKDREWSIPVKIGYKWNSDNNTAMVGINPTFCLFYRSYWRNNGEIFIAQRDSADTSRLKATKMKKMLAICSDYDEISATANRADTVIFVSNRNGNYDIFIKAGDSLPVPVEILNTEYDEEDVFLSEDSKVLYFSSDRPGGKGGFDIYRSDIKNGRFSKPVQVNIEGVNSEYDDRDFRIYKDSTMIFSSSRPGGHGGYDIYMTNILPPVKDTIVKRDTARIVYLKPIPVILKPEQLAKTLVNVTIAQPQIIDTVVKPTVIVPVIKPVVIDTVIHIVLKDTILEERKELISQLKTLGLFPFRGEVQLGAYRKIRGLEAYQQRFPCITGEDIRVDKQNVDTMIIFKYIINVVYTDIDLALSMQYKLINYHCLPEQSFSDMPFIAMLDENKNRFAIFWKKDEFVNRKVFYIFENGKQIWKTKKF